MHLPVGKCVMACKEGGVQPRCGERPSMVGIGMRRRQWSIHGRRGEKGQVNLMYGTRPGTDWCLATDGSALGRTIGMWHMKVPGATSEEYLQTVGSRFYLCPRVISSARLPSRISVGAPCVDGSSYMCMRRRWPLQR